MQFRPAKDLRFDRAREYFLTLELKLDMLQTPSRDLLTEVELALARYRDANGVVTIYGTDRVSVSFGSPCDAVFLGVASRRQRLLGDLYTHFAKQRVKCRIGESIPVSEMTPYAHIEDQKFWTPYDDASWSCADSPSL